MQRRRKIHFNVKWDSGSWRAEASSPKEIVYTGIRSLGRLRSKLPDRVAGLTGWQRDEFDITYSCEPPPDIRDRVIRLRRLREQHEQIGTTIRNEILAALDEFERLDMSQVDLAEFIGLSSQRISQIKAGK